MEKPSEQKQGDSDVTSMLTGKELLLKQCAAESEELLPAKCTDEPLVECADIECQKCHSSDINTMYIAGHDVLHCICNQCGYEWVE